MKIFAKTPHEKREVQIEESATIAQFREAVKTTYDAPSLESISLIFAGKILKDPETLQQHNVKEGSVIFVVIKGAQRPQPTSGSSSTPSLAADASSAAGASGSTASAAPSASASAGASRLGGGLGAGSAGAAGGPAADPLAGLAAMMGGGIPGGMGGMGGMGGLGMFGMPGMGGMGAPAGAGQGQGQGQGMGGIGGLPGMGGMGGMMQPMMQQLMNNPQAMQQMMSSPLMQSLFNNPEMLRSMMMMNPQMRELMERNPEMGHMLNNPAVLRQVGEMMRNPAMMQEMMRNYDRSLSNIESMPGGMGALQQMYHDVQEPLQSAADSALPNPFAPSGGSGGSSSAGSGSGAPAASTEGGEENTPMPNPWSSRTAATTGEGSSGGTGESEMAAGGEQQTPEGLLRQMMGNPQMVSEQLASPWRQSMLQYIQQNPQLMEQLLVNHPMFANNETAREQVRTELPFLLDQLSSPENLRLLSNPRVMGALMQIHQGFNILQEEVPDLFPAFGLHGLNPFLLGRQPPPLPPASAAGAPADSAGSGEGATPAPSTGTGASTGTGTGTGSAPTAPGSTPTSAASGTGTGTGGMPALGGGQQPGAPGQMDMNMMMQMMRAMGGMGGAGGMAPGAGGMAPGASGFPTRPPPSTVPPEQRYAIQLGQLAAMGFNNREANLQALVATLGNIDQAIDYLINNPQR